jgi:hypothetical protein
MSKKKFDQVIKKFLLNELTIPQNLEPDLKNALQSLPPQDKQTLVTVGDAQANAASVDPNDKTHGLLSQLIHPTDGPKTYDELVSKNPQLKTDLDKRIKEMGLTTASTQKNPSTTPTAPDTSKTSTPYKSAQTNPSTDSVNDHPGAM